MKVLHIHRSKATAVDGRRNSERTDTQTNTNTQTRGNIDTGRQGRRAANIGALVTWVDGGTETERVSRFGENTGTERERKENMSR